MVPTSVQNHRQGVEDLRNAHFLPVAGSRSWETPDCTFELVDDRDKLVCGEVDCSPARAADLIVLPKPRHGFLYLRAALRTHDWQHTVFENRHSYLPMSAGDPASFAEESPLTVNRKKETVMEDHRNSSKITRTETQASGGSKEGVVRYVLIVGLVLVVIAFVVAYLFA